MTWTNTAVDDICDSYRRQLDEKDKRIAELEAALRNARAQLVTLGGEALHVHGDGIQRAVLNEIDAVLKRTS